jgi:hypothetical protein
MLKTPSITSDNASEDDQGLEFGDEQSEQKSQSAENTNPGSSRASNVEETRRSKQLETIDEEEEGCYIKDSLA